MNHHRREATNDSGPDISVRAVEIEGKNDAMLVHAVKTYFDPLAMDGQERPQVQAESDTAQMPPAPTE
jgi:hypothetical protein